MIETCYVLRSQLLVIRDIEDALHNVVSWVGERSVTELVADPMRFSAVLHNLILAGEAAKRVPPELRARVPEVPWSNLARLRDVVVHRYHGLDDDIIWDVASNHAPAIYQHIRALREELEREEAERTDEGDPRANFATWWRPANLMPRAVRRSPRRSRSAFARGKLTIR